MTTETAIRQADGIIHARFPDGCTRFVGIASRGWVERTGLNKRYVIRASQALGIAKYRKLSADEVLRIIAIKLYLLRFPGSSMKSAIRAINDAHELAETMEEFGEKYVGPGWLLEFAQNSLNENPEQLMKTVKNTLK